ncbi:BatA and WFA domain-containing protein [Aestuariivivens sp. NBU2969]|uniref:vWA domain-containing protein n=1 Tax=Aestuariivivens sp. NBU2969 TaxID=2873267 RepID=UPI001CBD7AFB|nr:BatA and WFA domain-containing protein [Aestuariivivens sp. NBU2969]
MQFKHPEILYALFLLLIPIIVHLFQLRKFKKVGFTNVAFLKKAILQTRKSSQIKKWLVLAIRLLLFTAIIIAFAQPFMSNSSRIDTKSETVIYLDNSFSMQAKGQQGELLKRAVQDIIANVPEDENISIFTNDDTFKNTSIKAIKNELLQLDYTAISLPSEAALLKSNTLFEKNSNSIKNLVFISDFQKTEADFIPIVDSLTNLHLVKLQPVNTSNIAIDSAYISNTDATTKELTITLKKIGGLVENLPVSLYNNDNLIAKTAVVLDNITQTSFSLPSNTAINGKIVIDDTSLEFDNTLYFNINDNQKINVLAINETSDDFLKRIYTPDEFNYNATQIEQLDYNLISDQQLIILNELELIPNPLASTLKIFVSEGGSILIIPSNKIHLSSYNDLLRSFNLALNEAIQNEKFITTINYSHPLYNNGVFEKQVSNFQYPKANCYYPITSNMGSNALQFENGSPFLNTKDRVFLFSSALNEDYSNFKSSPLIVPTLYNIGKFSLKNPDLYYTIGNDNLFAIATQLHQDDILSLVNNNMSIIPRQQKFNKKVVVKTLETPIKSGIYAVKNKTQTLSRVSYNYNRKESDLTFTDLSKIDGVTITDSVNDVFDTIKSNTKINALWKWFVIFALLLLIIEMLILKYFK